MRTKQTSSGKTLEEPLNLKDEIPGSSENHTGGNGSAPLWEISGNDSDIHLRAGPSCRVLGISTSQFYAIQDPNSDQHDPTFPRGYQVSARIRVWRLSELKAWIESKR